MRERVLAIVSIIAQFVMEEREALSDSDIVEELLSVGFKAEEIDAAFTWMENLSLNPPSPTELTAPSQSHRVFTAEESRLFSPEARGFLLKLRFMGILDDELTEEILDKAQQDEVEDIGLKDLKAITALTLFARAQTDWRREVDVLLEDDWTPMFH